MHANESSAADTGRPPRGENRFRTELKGVLRRARHRLQMSQEELARALGERLGHPIGQSQISDWERGRFEPGATVLMALAEMADLSIDEIRGGGPPVLLERVEHLEEEIDGMAGKSERVAAQLAQIIEVLDRARLWPDEAPTGEGAGDGR